MADSRARVRVFSDDGFCVWDPLIMRRALEYVKAFDGVIAQHAQDPRLTEGAQMNEGAVSAELGLAGWPAVAEESIIARDVLLAEHVGSRLHVCHLSTAGSVDIIRVGQEARRRRHGRGHAAPPAAHRRARARLRRALQGEPAAAPRRGRARGARGPRRRHDRHRRHRPRAAPRRAQDVRVARRGERHGRARERAARRADGDGRHRDAITWADVARVHVARRRRASAGSPATALRSTAGQPAIAHALRPAHHERRSRHPTCTAAAATRRTSARELPGRSKRTRPRPRLPSGRPMWATVYSASKYGVARS